VQQWFNHLADRLEELEIKVENLAGDERFITVLTQSMLIAIRSHQEEKLDALRNAVINTAKSLFADDNVYLMFLNCVDAFTPWHIRVLNHLKSREFPMRDGGVDIRRINDPLTEEIRSIFPENEFDSHFIRQVFNDVSSRGFITITTLSQTEDGEEVSQARLTQLGRDFLRFISS